MRKELYSLAADPVSERLNRLALTLFHFGLQAFSDQRKLNAASLSCFRICIVKQGSYTLLCQKNHYLLKSGDLLMMRPGLFYDVISSKEKSCFYYFDFDLKDEPSLQQFFQLFPFSNAVYLSNFADQLQFDELMYLDQMVKDNYPGSYLFVKNTLLKILVNMLNLIKRQERTFIITDPTSRQEQLLQQFLDYIDQHISEMLTVRQIAEEFNYSESYIYQIFMSSMHISCKKFIVEYRLYKALRDLTYSALSITKIAGQYGFSSVYHFSYAFKKNFGCSPSEYRQNIQEEQKNSSSDFSDQPD